MINMNAINQTFSVFLPNSPTKKRLQIMQSETQKSNELLFSEVPRTLVELKDCILPQPSLV